MRVVKHAGVAARRVGVAANQWERTRGKDGAAILRPPCGKAIVLGEVVIHLGEPGLIEGCGTNVSYEIVAAGRGIGIRGSWPELQQRLRDGIGNRGAFGGVGNSRAADRRSYLAEALIGQKGEHRVLEDWSTKRSAILVAVQWILRSVVLVGEEIGRVQHRIAQILERGSVKLVRAAFGNNAHLTARAAPKLRSGHAGLHGKLLHGVGNAEVAECGVDLSIDVAHAVKQEDVGLRTGSGHVEAATLCASGGGQHARGQKSEVQILAGVQGHIRYHFALDDVAQRTPIIFQQGNCAAADFYGLANAANLKRGLNVRDLVDFHDDAFHNELLEAVGFHV